MIGGVPVTQCAKHQVTHWLQFIETRCGHSLSPDRFAFQLLGFTPSPLTLGCLSLCSHRSSSVAHKLTQDKGLCDYSGWPCRTMRWSHVSPAFAFHFTCQSRCCKPSIQSACLVYSHFLNMSARGQENSNRSAWKDQRG